MHFKGFSPKFQNFNEAREQEKSSFDEFSASQLYCPKCQKAMPVRPRVLLVLRDGEMIDYCCAKCGTSLGTRTGS